MRAQTYQKIIAGILILIALIFVNGNVSAENCLETWMEDNPRNMVANPGFEEEPDFVNWFPHMPDEATASIDSSDINDKSAMVEFSSDDDIEFSFGQGSISVNGDTTYLIQGYLNKINNVESSWSGSDILVVDQTSSNWKTTSMSETDGWISISKEFMTNSDTTSLNLYPRTKGYGFVSGTV